MTPDEEENFAQPTTSSGRDLNEIVKITDSATATNRRQSARVQIDGNTNDVPTSSDQVRVEFKQPVIEGTSGVAQTSESETAAARKSENDKAKSDSDSNVTFKVTSFFLLVIVPLLLLICILLRINFQSIIYMFMLFILPFFYPITYTNLQGNLKRYLIALVSISLLSLLGQLVFQIVLLANQPYGNEKILPNCSFKQEILEEFGYSRYDTAYIGDIFRILVPDVLLLIGCLISLHLCKRVQKLYVAAKREQVYNASAAVAAGVAVVNPILILSKAEGDVASANKATTTFTDHFCPLENVHASNNEIEAIDGAAEEIIANVSREKTPTPSLSPIRQADISLRPASTFRRALNTALPLSLETTFLLILFCCGSAWPSLASAPYFLASLALLVRWSLAYNIQHTRFQVNIKIGLLLYSALHLLVLYLYQMYLFQTYVAPRQSLVARLLGLTQFVYTRCEQPAHYYINWDTVKWQEICEPTFILALYWFIGVEFAYYGAFITTPATSNAMSLPMRREETGVLSQKTNPTNTDTDTDNDANEKQRLYNSDVNENDLVPAVAVKLRRFRNGSQATNYSNNGSNSRQTNQTTKTRKRRQTAVFFEVTRSYFNMTARFLHKQSYLLSLLSMMTWSILYHSVLTLILLVWACLIWVLPNSRHRCLVTSPWFLFYSTCLLICEFIYGLQLTSSELPEYKEVGLYRHDTPFLHLSVKTFMLLFYCLTMRQFITEKRAQRCLRALGANTSGYETTDTHFNSNLLLNSDMQSQITNLIYGILVKYWIFLSTATLLFMSCQNEVVAYRIGYMALFLYFITVFQLYYTFWRKTLFIFHLIVIIYSMLILLLIYVFQFEEVPAYFKRVFNIDDLVLSSIGFEKFASKDELIVRLLTPMTFLIVNILQIHYFNKPWLDITKVNEQAQYFSPSSVSSSSSQHKNEDQSGANVDESSNKVESTIVNMESPAIEKTGLEIQSISENPQTVQPSTSGIMKPSTSNLNEIISSNDPVLVVGHRYHHHHHRRHTHQRIEQSARPSTVSTLTTKTEREKFTSFLQRMLNNINWFYSLCCPYLWRIAELHIYKVIVIVIALFCFHKVSVINLILLCSVLFSFVSTQSKRSDRVHTLLSGFVQIWACVFTLASMLYQLKFVESPLVFNCSFAINRTDIDPYLLKPEDNLVYIGVEKANDILDYLKYYIFILLLLSFQKIIDIKMNFYRTKMKLAKPKYSTLFDGIDYKNLDQSLLNFLKYLVNYGFYRFGLEICLLMSSIVIIVRMDAYAIFYGVWLGVLLRLKRKTTSKIWTGYLIFLLFILPIQYIFCLGLPPILCYEYPWSASNQVNPSNILNKIRLWLFLPDYSEPPISYQLIADFFQVFFVWLQAGVFQLESTLESNDNDEETDELMTEFASKAGRNNELVDEVYAYRDNPYRDFVSETVTYFDKIKFGIYMYSYWFVLAIVYLTGTSRISLLCIGYVILSFFFLWLGQTFLMKPLDKLLKFWNILVFYCFLVIFIKACLQIVLCLLTGLVSDDIVCILIDVFGIDCRTLPGKKDIVTSACLKEGEKSEVGLVWDVFCFLVLILQRRLYMSYMFEHVVNEYKAQSTLAARGAEIFKEIINHKVEVERNKEIVILEKLKTNVERIRKHQSKECSYEPEEHYEALRSGDYYMFNAEFELDTTDITESEDDLMSTKKHHSSKSKQKKSSGKNSPSDAEQSSSLKPIDSVDTRETPTTETGGGEVVMRDPDTEKTEKEKEAETTNRQSWLTIENKTMLSAFELFKKYSFIAIDFVIDYLNKHSKDYRQVSHILSKEKLILKREYGNTQTPSLLVLLKSAINRETDEPPIQPLHELLAREDDAAKIIAAADEVDAEMNAQNRLNKFLSSIFYFTMSQSEFICYFFMILNHLNSASLLSVTLPISIFLWAMLCIPRPTKTFWITSITYIEAVVVIKYLFQFKLLPWNASQSASNENLIKVLAILGIQKQDNFAIYDLFALLVIFLHRTVLKRLGLWRDYLADDELLLASNEDEKRAQKKELAKINTNIYSEETGRSLTVEDSTEAPIANDENDQVDEENREEEQPNEEEEKEESDESDENGKDQEKKEAKEDNENETKVDLNELENSYNCLIDEELVQDPIEKEKLKERVKEKLQVAKKKRLVNPFIKFYNDMKTKHYAVVVDCYAKIFLCDFINCLITVFTYQYFGESARSAAKNTSSAISSIQDNKVPYSFLIMFLVQFILMIIDRALYLRKNRQGKFIFQVLLVLFVHVWVFFVLPYITKLNFVENSAAQVWYFVKCIYFGYSSRQIRCGYPTRILGNFLTKSYSYVNLVLFKGFLLVPFLLELRSLMDWMFTDTSLGLSDWLQMEDIYSNIFVLKCFRYNENKHPTPRGQKRQAIMKYGFGGVLLCIIILIIWFPLLLFSFSEGFNKSVPPQSCKIDIELSGFLPIYSMTSQQRQAQKYTKQMLDDFKKFAPEQSYSFLNDFTPEDVFCIAIPGNSTSTWQISPPSLASLKDLLTDPDPIDFDFIYTITRESSEQKNVQLSEVVTATRELLLDNSNKSVILNLLNNNAAESNSSVLIKSAYPRYIHARPKGHILEIDSFKYSENFKYYVDVRMALRNSSNELWWDVYDDNTNDYMPPCSKPGYLSLIVFSDKVSPSSISFITEQGIIGIYITIVLALSRFLRIMVVNSSQRIMFEQLPNVDRVLKLCHSVYMVRENKQYILEEYLYAKIIFLYRSPEVMIRYTKNDHEKKNQ